MNTANLLNNVLPLPAARSVRITPANSSSYDNSSSKHGIIQTDPLQTTPSDNLDNINSETQPKAKPTRHNSFKNVLKQHLKAKESTDDSAEQKTEIKTPGQDDNPATDCSQPVAAPVTETKVPTTDSLIPDVAVAGDTAPVPNSPTQAVDTSQVQIADTFIINDPLMQLQNQSQSPLTDLSLQIPLTELNQPAHNISQLITVPDKQNAPAQHKTENVVSLEPPVTRNMSNDNLITNINLELKSTEVTLKEGQSTQDGYSTSAPYGRLTVTGTATGNNQSVSASAEFPALQAVNFVKTNQNNESGQSKSQEQNRLNLQSTINNFAPYSESEGGQQSAIGNQQLIQTIVSQDKITDPLKKSDTAKSDLQNANITSQIARGLTTPESGDNVALSDLPKMPTEAIGNMTLADNDIAQAVREQISQSVAAAAQQLNRQITIQLNPPELGKVSVKFSQTGSELTGIIEASNPGTRADINQQIPEILRSLEQAGVPVKRIDVILSDLPGRSNTDSQRDNSSHLNWDRHAGNSFNDSTQQQYPSDYSTPFLVSTPSTASTPFESRATSHESRGASSALDVLI
jgi:flagellar hook-length control protein FliK